MRGPAIHLNLTENKDGDMRCQPAAAAESVAATKGVPDLVDLVDVLRAVDAPRALLRPLLRPLKELYLHGDLGPVATA